jgi:hypothetical protein
VIMRFDAPVSGPCQAGFDYGETEDYCLVLAIPTSVVERDPMASVMVFPDPADGEIFFDLSGFPQGMMHLDVIDNAGRVVIRQGVQQGNRVMVDTRRLAPGMYAYHLSSPAGQAARGRFMVAR